MNKKIATGRAERHHPDRQGKVANEHTHAHLSDGSALNKDGTWKHKGPSGTPAD
ncbi:hypothetical protein ACFORO_27800 [Amycolatopsis halotolerans]|uniref:Uncharacterized protein n=1 Tax=Amycolatopsis halotolerans TaxID=330083 RepID=A0ABV7QLS9_9PSEU